MLAAGMTPLPVPFPALWSQNAATVAQPELVLLAVGTMYAVSDHPELGSPRSSDT